MSGARRIWLVVRREWNQRVRSSAFRISTVVSAAVIVALIVSPQILGGDAKLRAVGMVGQNAAELPTLVQATGRELGLTVRIRDFADEAAGRDALLAGDVDVLLIDQRALLWKADVDEPLAAVVTSAVQAVERQRAVVDMGLTPDQQQQLRPTGPSSSSLEAGTKERSARIDLAMIGVGLLLLAITFYGSFLLVGVVEEKSSRVVEVLLSRIRPTELLAGKIAGIGLVGLAQLTVVAAAALIALGSSENPAIPSTTAGTVAQIVLWFVLGYGFYAVLYGAAGSLVSRQEETQSMTLPITGLMLIAYFVAMDAARSPDSLAATIGSFLPPSAPMVMIVRIANGGVPGWQIALAVLLMLAAIAGLVVLAGRIYTGAVLRLGRRVKLREAWHAGEA